MLVNALHCGVGHLFCVLGVFAFQALKISRAPEFAGLGLAIVTAPVSIIKLCSITTPKLRSAPLLWLGMGRV